jgi:tetratricopeptide (TPR) repeat protein
LDLLTEGAYDLPERHRTLRNAIQSSYALLTAPDQQLFRALGVFVGGFDIDALIGCGCNEAHLPSLVNKNLVAITPLPNDGRQLGLLETLREYALAQLQAHGEEMAMRQRHAAYYRACALHLDREGDEAARRAWLERLERQHDNLRAALRWLLSHQGQQAAELAKALYLFWFTRGYLSEGRHILAEVLILENLPLPLRAWLLLHAAHLAQNQDDHNAAAALVEQSLHYFAQWDDLKGRAEAHYVQGWTCAGLGAYAAARDAFSQSRTLFQQAGEPAKVAMQAVHIADIYLKETRYAEARAYLEAALTDYRQLNRWTDVAQLLGKQGQLEAETGQYVLAVRKLEEALTLFRQAGSQHIGWLLSSLGYAYRRLGNLTSARVCYQEAHQLFSEQQGKLGILVMLHHLGVIEELAGNHPLAFHYHADSLRLAVEQENLAMTARNLVGFGALALAQGTPARAAALFAAAQTLFDKLPPFLSPADDADYQQWMADTRLALGDKEFTVIWNEWRTRAGEAAVAYALAGQIA